MKKKTIQRAFAWALTLVMVLSAAPLGVFAEGEEGQTCTCTVKCGEEGNAECPVCSTDAEKCAVVTPKQEDEGKEGGGTDTLTKNDGGTPSGGEGGPSGNDTTKNGSDKSDSNNSNTNDNNTNDNTNTNNSNNSNSSSTGGNNTSDQKQNDSLEFKKNDDIKTGVIYGEITPGDSVVPYKITFDTLGKGNAPQEMTTDENGKLSGELPTLDNVDGYTFGGWYLDKDCSDGKAVNKDEPFSKDTILYARWTPITYTVVFHRNYSTPNETYTQTFAYNSSDQLGSISREYYEFNCWAEAPDGGGLRYFHTHTVGELVFGQKTTLDLYAVWDYKPRKVTFDACGGKITKDGQEVPSDEVKTQESPLNTVKAEEVPTPTKEGYTFLGWYDQKTNNKFSLNTVYNEDTTLEARWVVLNKPDNVTLGENFLKENTLPKETDKVEIRVEQGSNTRLHQISNILGNKLNGKKLLAVYDLSVYMIIGSEHQPLTPVKGLIQFDFPVTGNVAAVYHNTDSMPVSDGSKAGYLQNGNILTIWADSFSPYAIAIDGYQIELDPQGGTLAAGVSNSMLTNPDGILENLPEPPTKTGYTFGGWYRSTEYKDADKVEAGAKFESNATIYAKWEPITYTVVFHDNYRKKEETSEQPFTYEEEQPLRHDDTKINRDYYHLDGWAETPDGKIKYGTGSKVKNLCSEDGGKKDLYAVWSYLPQTVIFDADGGKIKDNGQELYSVIVQTQESPINTVKAKEVPVPMTREGYYFGGWYTEKDGKGDLVKPDKTEFPQGRTTVYAYWIKFEPVTVTFKCQGGTARIGSTDVKEFTMQTKWPGVLDGTPTTPSRSSYKFEGWYTAAGVKVDEDTLFLKDSTVYARWKRAVSITGNPRTGDQVKLEAAIAILVAAAIGLGATVVLKKRKDK